MVEILAEDDVTIVDAKRIMDERKKEGDLNYEQKISYDFFTKVVKMTQKQLQDMVEELNKINILKPRHLALIVNNMPDTEDEVNAVFSKERTNLTKEETNQIIETVKKFKK
ncbi:MAG: RNA polymerase Rpb4 family protein [Candidatus Aenigmatarchaeota archaeon]